MALLCVRSVYQLHTDWRFRLHFIDRVGNGRGGAAAAALRGANASAIKKAKPLAETSPLRCLVGGADALQSRA
jgi:hypothetical protein